MICLLRELGRKDFAMFQIDINNRSMLSVMRVMFIVQLEILQNPLKKRYHKWLSS